MKNRLTGHCNTTNIESVEESLKSRRQRMLERNNLSFWRMKMRVQQMFQSVYY